MRRARAWSALAAAIAVAGACGEASRPAVARGALGRATAEAVLAAVAAAADEIEPWRCARPGDTAGLVAPPGWRLDGARLIAPEDAAPHVAVLGEARGDATAVAGLRAALDAAPPAVVVTIGGMATTQAELTALLAPLAEGAPWLLVAVPGDREALPAHRAAVAALAARGARVVDGTRARVIDLGAIRIGTLPGAPARGLRRIAPRSRKIPRLPSRRGCATFRRLHRPRRRHPAGAIHFRKGSTCPDQC